MSTKLRSAFTLVELLVVIAIIGTLVSMVVPAVMQARENARRALCLKNLKTLGEAIEAYKTKTQGAFPGYNERIGNGINPTNNGAGIRVPWTVVLLNHLDQVNLYKEWRKKADPDPMNLDPALAPRLDIYYCPSSEITKGREGPALCYVLNCGRGVQQGTDENIANGLGVDRFTNPALRATDATLADDGASYTLLLGENLQAGDWTNVEKKDVGMVWWSGNPSADAVINGNKRTATRSIQTARPSSMHYNGANYCFADGRTVYLRENISYQVYRQLLAPIDEKSDMTCAPNCPPISDDDFR